MVHDTVRGDSSSHHDLSRPVDARVLRTREDVLSAATRLLIEDGWDAVTQPNVARAAGYSKVTVYTHWPDRLDLIGDVFARIGAMPHHHPLTGDLRTDLIGELASFRTALIEHHLDRVLTVLADRCAAIPALGPVRDRFVADGERILRELLGHVPAGPEREAAVQMLGGLVVDGVLLHGTAPDDDTLAAAVDLVLGGLSVSPT